MTELSGRAAIITGGGRGIGMELAHILAGQGVSVFLCARGGDECARVAGEITAAGGRAEAMACDVADYAQVEAMTAAAMAAFGRLDILINNAGVLAPEDMIADAEPGAWADNIRINLVGPYHAARAALPHLTAAPDGVIVNISTGAAHHALPGWSAYCASKAGLAMLTQCLHVEHGGTGGLRVYGLEPGTVATVMQEELRKRKINEISNLPLEALKSPKRPATVIAYLCTPAAADLAGGELAVADEGLLNRAGWRD